MDGNLDRRVTKTELDTAFKRNNQNDLFNAGAGVLSAQFTKIDRNTIEFDDLAYSNSAKRASVLIVFELFVVVLTVLWMLGFLLGYEDLGFQGKFMVGLVWPSIILCLSILITYISLKSIPKVVLDRRSSKVLIPKVDGGYFNIPFSDVSFFIREEVGSSSARCFFKLNMNFDSIGTKIAEFTLSESSDFGAVENDLASFYAYMKLSDDNLSKNENLSLEFLEYLSCSKSKLKEKLMRQVRLWSKEEIQEYVSVNRKYRVGSLERIVGVIVIVGIYFICGELLRIKENSAAREWPKAEVNVISIENKTRWYRSGYYYKLESMQLAIIEYVVGDVVYRKDGVDLGVWYRDGLISYNPNNPNQVNIYPRGVGVSDVAFLLLLFVPLVLLPVWWVFKHYYEAKMQLVVCNEYLKLKG